MDNLGQYFKNGIKRASEAAMDAFVTSIITNQEQHLHNLQDMQKWGVIKLIQRWTTSKYLHQRPNVIKVQDWSLFNMFNGSAMSCTSSSIPSTDTPQAKNVDAPIPENKNNSVSYVYIPPFIRTASISSRLGELCVEICQCTCVLMEHPLTFREDEIQKYDWKVVVKFQHELKETGCSLLTRFPRKEAVLAGVETPRSVLGVPHISSSYYHAVIWNTPLAFDSVKDLWADICIDVMWRRRKEDFDSGTRKLFDDTLHHNTEITPRFLCETKKIHDESLYVVRRDSQLIHRNKSKHTGNDDEQNTVLKKSKELPLLLETNLEKKSEAGNEWTLYGRAIVPLASVLSSFNACTSHPSRSSRTTQTLNTRHVRSESHQPSSPQSYCDSTPEYGTSTRSLQPLLYPITGHRWTSSHDLWLNLYPHKSKELKYYRPVAGYPALGMFNPRTTLGFLHVKIFFSSPMSKTKALLLSTFNAPTSRWTNAFSFEPQYLETYGLRARHLFTVYPRWVSKFLHLFPSMVTLQRNRYDYIFLVIFWISTIIGVLFLPLYLVPLALFVIVLSVSMSYHWGYHAVAPCIFTLLYEIPCLHHCHETGKCKHVRTVMRNCPGTPYSDNNCNVSTPLSKNFSCPHTDPPNNLGCNNDARFGRLFVKESDMQEIIKGSGGLNAGMVRSTISAASGAKYDDMEREGRLSEDDREIQRLPTSARTVSSEKEEPKYRSYESTAHFHCHNSGGISESSIFAHDSFNYGSGTKKVDDDRKEHVQNGRSHAYNKYMLDGEAWSIDEQDTSKVYRVTPSRGRQLPTSVIKCPFGKLVLNVIDKTSYCGRFPVFADDVGDQDVHVLLDGALDLLDGIQRVSGLVSSTIEKLKFAFNWEDPLLTMVSYIVLLLICSQLSLMIYIAMHVPRWMRRFPLLLPLFFFIFVTDPWILRNIWFNIFGVNLPLIYHGFLSRAALQRDQSEQVLLRYAALPSALPEERAEDKRSQAKCLTYNRNDDIPLHGNLFLSNGTSRNEFRVQDTETPSVNSWNSLRHRFNNIIKGNKKLSSNEPPMADGTALLHSADSTVFDKNDNYCYSSQMSDKSSQTDSSFDADVLSVLSVRARITTLRQSKDPSKVSRCLNLLCIAAKSLYALLNFAVTPLLRFIGTFLGYSLITPLLSMLLACFFLFLHVVDIWIRVLWYWWIRLPDRREIEHRQIAACQYAPQIGSCGIFEEALQQDLRQAAPKDTLCDSFDNARFPTTSINLKLNNESKIDMQIKDPSGRKQLHKSQIATQIVSTLLHKNLIKPMGTYDTSPSQRLTISQPTHTETPTSSLMCTEHVERHHEIDAEDTVSCTNSQTVLNVPRTSSSSFLQKKQVLRFNTDESRETFPSETFESIEAVTQPIDTEMRCTLLSSSVFKPHPPLRPSITKEASQSFSESLQESPFPQSEGDTAFPEGGGDTTVPESGGKTTLPENAGDTTFPQNAGDTTFPQNAGDTPFPQNAGDTPFPQNAEDTSFDFRTTTANEVKVPTTRQSRTDCFSSRKEPEEAYGKDRVYDIPPTTVPSTVDKASHSPSNTESPAQSVLAMELERSEAHLEKEGCMACNDNIFKATNFSLYKPVSSASVSLENAPIKNSLRQFRSFIRSLKPTKNTTPFHSPLYSRIQ